jgi:aldehyde dehydrogenase (NAD+)
MDQAVLPKTIVNWIDGEEREAITGDTFGKLSPVSGQEMCRVSRSRAEDVHKAVEVARKAQQAWADSTPVSRGDLLHDIAQAMRQYQEEIASIVSLETGMSFKQALGETGGAIAQGEFMAGEGRRLYGRTTTSAVPNKYAMVVRQPLGVAALIIAANTPIANVAWKIFPALICGNAAVLKAAEDTPATAWIVGRIAKEVGLPPGVLNIVQGFGEEAGAPLVASPEVDVISFTGSTEVGRQIAEVAARRLAKVSLELGGKNPLVVCDDADLGPGDDDDFGPVINEVQLTNMLSAVERAREEGALVLTGGQRLTDPEHVDGFYMAPTILENVGPQDEISTKEIFGPITCLYRVQDFAEALSLANDSPYGLTACIHTRSIHRAIEFSQKIQAGVAMVNGGTYGSEPHMPFGGLKQSGNGTREPGTEALDVYSDLKDICINIDTEML